jgi:hypothetical protein
MPVLCLVVLELFWKQLQKGRVSEHGVSQCGHRHTVSIERHVQMEEG